MIKNQNFYQSILQNSTLVIKVSDKICDNQDNIDNVISDIKELLNSISKLKVVFPNFNFKFRSEKIFFDLYRL